MIILFRKETFYLEFPILMMLSSKLPFFFVWEPVTCFVYTETSIDYYALHVQDIRQNNIVP